MMKSQPDVHIKSFFEPPHGHLQRVPSLRRTSTIIMEDNKALSRDRSNLTCLVASNHPSFGGVYRTLSHLTSPSRRRETLHARIRDLAISLDIQEKRDVVERTILRRTSLSPSARQNMNYHP